MPVYVVDSSGNGFPSISNTSPPNVRFFTFEQPPEIERSTDGELLSLRKAEEHWRTDWERNSYDYIVKVTGKYRLPDLEIELRKVQRKDFDFILQNRGHLAQNTEVLGIRRSKFRDILQEISAQEDAEQLEEKVINVMRRLDTKNFRLPSNLVPLEFQVKRGWGDVLSNLTQIKSSQQATRRKQQTSSNALLGNL